MRLGKYLMAAAAATMSVAPAMAAPVAVQSVRADSALAKKNELAGGGGAFVAIIAVIAVIVGVVIVADSDDTPDSP